MALAMAVQQPERHRYTTRGDGSMTQQYAATYHLKGAIVHVVAPPPMSAERKAKIDRDISRAFLAAWKTLSPEKQEKYNLGFDLTKVLQKRLLAMRQNA